MPSTDLLGEAGTPAANDGERGRGDIGCDRVCSNGLASVASGTLVAIDEDVNTETSAAARAAIIRECESVAAT